ncbi:MAG: TonB-dependent receptor [Saprospiraceae bacterium]|nr:TonB-dependent receptor [Saprospiraceae bacterium]
MIDNNDNIQLKGKNGVRIYIDGKPSYFSAQELANFLKGIASSDIEAVEIITNPSAKYDAQGNAGIINLRLKKNKNFGTNGSANLSLGYGVFHKSFLSLNLNNRVNKWNTYGNIGIGNSKYDNEMNLYREQDGKIFDQNQSQVSNRPVNAKIGVDYAINSKTYIRCTCIGQHSIH